MRQQPIPDPQMIDVDSIKTFIDRSRDPLKFAEVKASIAKDGLKKPIQVRDISARPLSDRKKDGGGAYRYELIMGQGRTAAYRELGKKRIPAYVIDVPEAEIVGRFWTENMIREDLPWNVKAKLVESELREGRTYAEIADDLSISPKHVQKFHHILRKVPIEIKGEVLAMSMNEAETLIALDAADQKIVVEVLKETGEKEIKALVRKARQVREQDGELSPMALKKSIQRVDDDLKRLRDSLKVTRLHASLGPQNLELLLADKKFRKAAESAGVPFHKFEKLTK
jgi:ParB family transcriptional regulator, chromosome partitioning protein